MTPLTEIIRRAAAVLGFNEPTRDDVINAQIEDKARDHASLVRALHEAFQKRSKSNGALRESIRIAKERTNSFSDFERLMAMHREEHHRD